MHGIHKNKNSITSRLSRIEGQVRGIQKMIEDDRYCIDIIVQTSAIKQAISTVEDIMLESHLSHCFKEAHTKSSLNTSNTMYEEIIKVYKLKRK